MKTSPIFICLILLLPGINSETNIGKQDSRDIALVSEESKLNEHAELYSDIEDDYYDDEDDYYYEDEYENVKDPEPQNPLSDILPLVKLDCSNVQDGYYADIEFDCKVFHYCQNKKRHTFMCPPKSWFNQQNMICDYDELASDDCESSTRYFNRNEQVVEHTGAKRKTKSTKKPHQIPAPPRTTTPKPTAPTVYIDDNEYIKKRPITEGHLVTVYKHQTLKDTPQASLKPRPLRKRPSGAYSENNYGRYKTNTRPKEHPGNDATASYTGLIGPSTGLYPPTRKPVNKPTKKPHANFHNFAESESVEERPAHNDGKAHFVSLAGLGDDFKYKSNIKSTHLGNQEQSHQNKQALNGHFPDLDFDRFVTRNKPASTNEKIIAGSQLRPHHADNNFKIASSNRNNNQNIFAPFYESTSNFRFTPKQRFIPVLQSQRDKKKENNRRLPNFEAADSPFVDSPATYDNRQNYDQRKSPPHYQQNQRPTKRKNLSHFGRHTGFDTFQSLGDHTKVFHSFRFPDDRQTRDQQNFHHSRFKRDLSGIKQTSDEEGTENDGFSPSVQAIFDPKMRLAFPQTVLSHVGNRRQLRQDTYSFPVSAKINFDDVDYFSSGSEIRQGIVSHPQFRRTPVRTGTISDFFRRDSFSRSTPKANRNSQSSRHNSQQKQEHIHPVSDQKFGSFASSNGGSKTPALRDSRASQQQTTNRGANTRSNQFQRGQSFQPVARQNHRHQGRATFVPPAKNIFKDRQPSNNFRPPVPRRRQPEIFFPASFEEFDTRAPNFKNFEPHRHPINSPTVIRNEPEYQFIPDFNRHPITQFNNPSIFGGRPQAPEGPRTEFGRRPNVIRNSRPSTNFVGSVIYDTEFPSELSTPHRSTPTRGQRIPDEPRHFPPTTRRSRTNENSFRNPFDDASYQSPPKNRRIPLVKPQGLQIQNGEDDQNAEFEVNPKRIPPVPERTHQKPIEELQNIKDKEGPPINPGGDRTRNTLKKHLIQNVHPVRPIFEAIDPINSEFVKRKPPKTLLAPNQPSPSPFAGSQRHPSGTSSRRPPKTEFVTKDDDAGILFDLNFRRPFDAKRRRRPSDDKPPRIQVEQTNAGKIPKTNRRKPLRGPPRRPPLSKKNRPFTDHRRPGYSEDNFKIKPVPGNLETPGDGRIRLSGRRPNRLPTYDPATRNNGRPRPINEFSFERRPFNPASSKDYQNQNLRRPTIFAPESEKPFSQPLFEPTEPFTRFPPPSLSSGNVKELNTGLYKEAIRPPKTSTNPKDVHQDSITFAAEERVKDKTTTQTSLEYDDQIHPSTGLPDSVSPHQAPQYATTTSHYKHPEETLTSKRKQLQRPVITTTEKPKRTTITTTESVPTTKRLKTRTRSRYLKRRRNRLLRRRKTTTTTTVSPNTEENVESNRKKSSRRPGSRRRTRHRSRSRSSRSRSRKSSTTTTTTTKQPSRKIQDERQLVQKTEASLKPLTDGYPKARGKQQVSTPRTVTAKSTTPIPTAPSSKTETETQRVKNFELGGRIFNYNQNKLKSNYRARLRQLAKMRLKLRLRKTTESRETLPESTLSIPEFTKIQKTTTNATTKPLRTYTEAPAKPPRVHKEEKYMPGKPQRTYSEDGRSSPEVLVEPQRTYIEERNRPGASAKPQTTHTEDGMSRSVASAKPERTRQEHITSSLEAPIKPQRTSTEAERSRLYTTEATTKSLTSYTEKALPDPRTTTPDSEIFTKDVKKRVKSTTTELTRPASTTTESEKEPLPDVTEPSTVTSSKGLPKTAFHSRKTSSASKRLKALRRRRLRLRRRRKKNNRRTTTAAPAESGE